MVPISFTFYRNAHTGPIPPAASTGLVLFWNVYMHSGGINVEGKYNSELRQKLVEYLRDPIYSGNLRASSQLQGGPEEYIKLFGRFEANPKALADEMFAKPHVAYYWVFQSMVSSNKADLEKTLVRACVEQIARHPGKTAWDILMIYKALALGPAWRFNAAARTAEAVLFAPFSPHTNDPRRANLKHPAAEK